MNGEGVRLIRAPALTGAAPYAYAAAAPPGARLAVGVSVLGYRDQLVEVEAVAVSG